MGRVKRTLANAESSGGRLNAHTEGVDGRGEQPWRKNFTNLREIFRYMWTNTKKFGWSHDVTFEVGSVDKVRFTAHRSILIVASQFFEDLFKMNANDSRGEPLTFPNLKPVGFQKVLDFIYATDCDISQSGPKDILALLDAARMLLDAGGCTTLENKCYTFLRWKITSENAAELYHISKESKDERLANLVSVHIAWYSPIQIIKGWCLSKHSSRAGHSQSGELTGEQLRATMGAALYDIRFPRMSKDEFFLEVLGKTGGALFRGDEIQQFSEYFYSSAISLSQTGLQNFVSRPRCMANALPSPPSPEAGAGTSNCKIGSSALQTSHGRNEPLVQVQATGIDSVATSSETCECKE